MITEELREQRGRLWAHRFQASYEWPMRYADVVIARGRVLADVARKLNSNVVETLPIGHMAVQKNESDGSVPSGSAHLLYIGMLSWGKGLADLLSAFRNLVRAGCKSGANWHLDIVGNGADMADIKEMAASFELQPQVTFHGYVDCPLHLEHLFTKARVVIVPSSSHPEGVPRVIDEALVRGVPVIATRIGGIASEFAEDEVMLVEPNAPAQLSRAIELILFDEETRRRYLNGARKRGQRWLQNGSAAKQHAALLLD
jgi:glycosyltransferase involved in cell wall biosynthesis